MNDGTVRLPELTPAQRAELVESLRQARAAGIVVVPSVPTWTATPPTRPGWYWWRGKPTDVGVVCRVSRDQYGACVGTLRVWLSGNECEDDTSSVGGEWAGPLLPPE